MKMIVRGSMLNVGEGREAKTRKKKYKKHDHVVAMVCLKAKET